MKKAIVTGANGYIGKSVVSALINNNVDVLAITRQFGSSISKIDDPFNRITYLSLDLKDISSLPEHLSKISWDIGDDCVFFHFAWEGDSRLMDGSIEKQMQNVTICSNSVITASKLGCKKFINSGTIEETIAEDFLSKSWVNKNYGFQNGNYAIAKIAARNMAKLVAYLNKIDYVHVRFSVAIDSKLSGSGYISAVFKNILDGLSYEKPANTGLFDIIDLEDLANAFYKIGLVGRNKDDFFIGSGFPKRLEEYFELFKLWNKSGKYSSNNNATNQIFDTVLLNKSLGINLEASFYNLLKKISNK